MTRKPSRNLHVSSKTHSVHRLRNPQRDSWTSNRTHSRYSPLATTNADIGQMKQRIAGNHSRDLQIAGICLQKAQITRTQPALIFISQVVLPIGLLICASRFSFHFLFSSVLMCFADKRLAAGNVLHVPGSCGKLLRSVDPIASVERHQNPGYRQKRRATQRISRGAGFSQRKGKRSSLRVSQVRRVT